MSRSHLPSSLSGSKRAISPTTGALEEAAQRPRLSDPPAAVRPLLSPAQSCATDTITLVFGFSKFDELVFAAQTCRAWLAAAAKGKPRGLHCRINEADQLADLCAGSSPFKRHISRVVCCGSYFSLGLDQLAQLSELPGLTELEVQLSAAALHLLLEEEGGGALAAVTAAFPRRLQELTLLVSLDHWEDACQLMVDALPAMKELEHLTMDRAFEEDGDLSATLALAPLLQLPRLTQLSWGIGRLTESQLRVIKQISTLQHFDPGEGKMASAQLSALCRPPHRLQRLLQIGLWNTAVDAAAMVGLIGLPSLTAIEPRHLAPAAYAHLPRFPRLRSLSVSLDSGADSDQQAEHNALLVSALSACSALTDLTLTSGECSESIGSRLLQAVRRLRTLSLHDCSVPSLRFLRRGQNLKELCLFNCKDVRPGHVIGVGAFAPQLERLSVEFCAALRLDEAEVRLLSPPGALGLPRLREFDYRPTLI